MILVTGSEGFLGRHLVAALHAVGYDTRGVDRTSGKACQTACYPHPDTRAIIHLAADAVVGECWASPAETTANNIEAAQKALLWSAALDIPLIIVTTDKVYPGRRGYRYREHDELFGLCPYSASKVLIEQMVSAWRRFNPQRILVVRPGNLVGTDDHNESRLFPQIRSALLDTGIMPWVALYAKRQWVDVDDVADGIVAALDAMLVQGVYLPPALNMAGRDIDASSVGAILDEFRRQTGRVIEFGMNTPQYPECMELLVDSSLARDVLGWQAIRPLPETIAGCRMAWGL